MGPSRSCQRAIDRASDPHGPLTPVQTADLEDALAERLDELGVTGSYELAAAFAGAGIGPDWVTEVVDRVEDDLREAALRWLAETIETEALMEEIEDVANRISTLVAAVKDYSHMDQASLQEVDLHAGLDSSVVMLGGKLGAIEVIKDYDRGLPPVTAWPAELNQVWTNLLDNAAHALSGHGSITLRTRRDGDHAVVEVGDDGPRIAPEVLPRIWEPFFTTKRPGEGSGLGLDNTKRIIERRHQGTIGVDTGPEGTTFRVRLPLATAG